MSSLSTRKRRPPVGHEKFEILGHVLQTFSPEVANMTDSLSYSGK